MSYDRWDQQVFSKSNSPANDPSLGWNVTYLGQQINTGVFM